MSSAWESRLVNHTSGGGVLDTLTDRHVTSLVATGISWLEVNPAAVRTDGGPGSRLLESPHSRKGKSLRLRFVNEERATLWQHHVNVRRTVGSSNRNIHPVDNPKSDLHAQEKAHTTTGESHE